MISYWEKKAYFDSPDFVIAGAGIVGMSAAYFLRQKNPKAKIIVLDSAPFSDAASFKNAGFACFGSPGELLNDYMSIGKDKSLETVKMRFNGLKALNELVDFNEIDYQACGSWEMFSSDENLEFNEVKSQIESLNSDLEILLNEKKVFQEDNTVEKNFGFQNLPYAIFNRLEGSIDVSKLNLELLFLLNAHRIPVLRNSRLLNFEDTNGKVELTTPYLQFSCSKLLIATNGFSKRLLPALDLKPARAQVLITSPIKNLAMKGTFHMNKGYDYFRNVGNRILIGGGRNLDQEGETTEEFQLTDVVQNHLKNLLSSKIIPGIDFNIEHQWAGIMGVGASKSPLIAKYSKNISYGIRMGGMGVAIGTNIGKELAELSLMD